MGWGRFIGTFVSVAFAALAAMPGCATAQPTQRQLVRVGLYDNTPKVGIAPDGRAEGVFVDVLEEIARREGWRIEYVPGSWRQGLERLAAGQIDLMPDVALTGERASSYAFHQEPVLTSWNEVFVRHGAGIRSLPDLQGKRIAVLDGSMQQDYLLDLASGFGVKLEVRGYPDFRQAFEAVSREQADAVVSNRFYGLRHARAAGLEATAIMFNPSGLYFAAPKGSDGRVLAAIDKHLPALKRDAGSAYGQSLRRWGAEASPPAIPPWVGWALPTAALLLALSAGWTATARRQAARLARSEAIQRELADELSLILEHSLDAICVFDADLRFVRVSPACQKLWGYRPDELLGRSYLDLVPGEDREATQSFIARLRAGGGRGTQVLDSRTLRKDGTVAAVVWSAAWSPAQQRWYGIARDDTDRRQLLRESERRARDLERAAAELAVARDEAQAADRTKSAFLATMSHELRTPLNSIIGFTGIVLQELAGPLTGEQKKQLSMVRDSSRHLLALINDVLDISKIEAGELRIVAAPFDLRACITKVAGIVEPLARRKGLALRVAIHPDLREMRGDSRRIEQVLLNLLGNAIKFTEHGHVTLDVQPAAEAVCFRVSDTGIGIRQQDLGLLFRPFRQLDSALSRSHEGTGLGLAICGRLAGLMGGTIDVQSTWGQGSTFGFTLPLQLAVEEATS